ncbi:chemotaxis protein CheB [Nitrosomonas supralitoralis]|uniref:chemotaxis protein CheB n=1 Tax=Nitrosomonas supralitoralis TaxID=2116706 RepID=UPI00215E6AF7|nr:chemotaxis protein CheB [Nitrosomonas supralitoralis]
MRQNYRKKSICIVLTDADHDGTIGLKAIKAEGGMAMAQQPETAQHPDMPQSAIHTGLVDYVLPIEQMGEKLIHYIDQTGFWRFETHLAPEKEAQTLGHILNLIGTSGGGVRYAYFHGVRSFIK